MNFIEAEREAFENDIEPFINELGFKLVQADIVRQRKSIAFRIAIFSEYGVTVDDCAKVSRFIEKKYPFEEKFGESYSLEISSPGIGRILRRIREYKAFYNRKIELYLNIEIEGTKNIVGTIEGVDKEVIHLKMDDRIVPINIYNINKGKLISDKEYK